jgi:hypothetical protein
MSEPRKIPAAAPRSPNPREAPTPKAAPVYRIDWTTPIVGFFCLLIPVSVGTLGIATGHNVLTPSMIIMMANAIGCIYLHHRIFRDPARHLVFRLTALVAWPIATYIQGCILFTFFQLVTGTKGSL